MSEIHFSENTTIDPSLLARKIIHVDMDCFYAAVEIRDDPRLRGRPVVIGGSPNSRGVVSTCSYEARKFGIHSAMACSQAYRLCPSAIFVPPSFEKYQAVSSQIRAIFRSYTELVEPLSLDEAFLDVTASELYATEIATRIKAEIRSTTGLTGSAGVGPNKLIAKIASDLDKPDGLTVVKPHRAEAFIGPLPLRKIPGVGPVTERQLAGKGFKLCRDVWPYSTDELERLLGPRMASWLAARSRGLDDRPVQTSWDRKSLGRERTFGTDIIDRSELCTAISKMAESVVPSLARGGFRARTITLKIRYADFRRITRSKTVDAPTDSLELIRETALELLNKVEDHPRGVRLVGISLSNLADV